MPGKLIICRGYSGSGKSTWSKKYQADHPEERAIVTERDMIRRDQLGYTHKTKTDRATEQMVTTIQQGIVRAGLADGRTVVVSDTNLVLRFAREWAALAQQEGAEFHVADFMVDKYICLAQNEQRPLAEQVPAQVIHDQAKRWPYLQWQEVTPKPREHADPPARFEPDESLPPAIGFDIDGTLAHIVERDIYDAARAHEDTLDPHVMRYLRSVQSDGIAVVVMSGRSEDHREVTERWLAKHGIEYAGLFMRPSKDTRPDFVVKGELFDKHLRGKYNVQMFVDDRAQIVRLWRDMGIICWQVADGNF